MNKTRKNNAQQLVKMINFELSFEGFDSHRSNTKKKFISLNNAQNELINSILDVKINNFVNYTQLSLNRPYSYLYKNKR
jgi:hypothetical protein